MLVFLGNPGKVYEKNRHNAGRLVVEHFSFIPAWRAKFKGLFAELHDHEWCGAEHPPVYLLEPETYMNLSGESVVQAMSFFKLKPEELLIIHDELELALGQAALKFSGGLSGHNGLRSIKASLGSADFWRLRIGVGRPAGDKAMADISGWVLSDFSREEEPLLQQVLAACAGALRQLVSTGPESLFPAWRKITIATAV
jgi:PTH1 family peptidyl-tRNA hydrolase